MSFSIDELTSFDNITSRGQNIDREIGSEVLFYITTPRESIPYSRSVGTRVRENRPLTLQRDVEISVSIIESIQLYNESVSNEITERRVSIDYNSIEYDFSEQQTGGLLARVPYTQLKDLKQELVQTE